MCHGGGVRRSARSAKPAFPFESAGSVLDLDVMKARPRALSMERAPSERYRPGSPWCFPVGVVRGA